MENFDSIEKVAQEIKNKLTINSGSTKKHVLTLYAFNGTGKTRLSSAFNLLNEELNEDEMGEINIDELSQTGIPEPTRKVLCYNAFLEDLFRWDNGNCILCFEKGSWVRELIDSEGLEPKIIDNFKRFLNTKIEPSFNLEEGQITFNILSGDDESQLGIKISRGEESVFIRSVFYTIVESVINELNSDEGNRSTALFDDLEYIVIDDPVSSIDDTKIITMAVELLELLNGYVKNKLKFLITTHHALFYNVLYNSFGGDSQYKYYSYILSKNGLKLNFKEQQNDSLFGYHLLVIDDIKKAIASDNLQKYHFNLFRGILEKTANFLGIKKWGGCVNGDRKEEFIRLINLYSHNKLEHMEYREVSDDDKILFKEKFEDFIQQFNWNN